MTKIKRVISIILVWVLLLMLVACKKEKDVVITKTKENGAKGKTSKTMDLRDEIYPAFDMGGRTIKIASFWPHGIGYDSWNSVISDVDGLSKNDNAQKLLDNVRRIEKKYNVKIDIVDLTEHALSTNMYKSIAAGKPDMDVYMFNFTYGMPALVDGLALPIKEYAPEYCDIMKDRVVMDSIETCGDEYLFNTKVMYKFGNVLIYNKDLIDQLGLEDPAYLYERGEWNWDKFAEYALAATKDINGDGEMDQLGYKGNSYVDMSFVYSNNGIIANSPVEGITSPNVVEAFNFINQLYNVDKSATAISMLTGSQNNYISLTDGNLLFYGGNVLSLGYILQQAKTDLNYKIVPYPIGPHGDGTMNTSFWKDYWFFIPKGADKPDQIYQITEEYFNWFSFDITLNSYKDIDDALKYVKQEDIDLSLEEGKKEVFDMGTFLNDGSIPFMFDYYDNIVVKGKPVANLNKEYQKKFQDRLDKIFRKR